MPISRSAKRGADLEDGQRRPNLRRPLIVIGAATVVAVIIVALPASWVGRLLPSGIVAGDFSGSLWHGSAGKVVVNGRDYGALEWHIHPWPLFLLTLSADLHWVKTAFTADGSVELDAHHLSIRELEGGGPVEDLIGFGATAGIRGAAEFKFDMLRFDLGSGGADAGGASLASAVGDVNVSNLILPRVADGADLGGYALHVADGVITPGADATAELNDRGGPLEVEATIHLSVKDRTGMLSGTVKERPDAPPGLHERIENLAEFHARDAHGRIPVDFEFTF